MGLDDDFGWYSYVSDNGSTYAVKLSVAVATAGSWSEFSGNIANNGWPFGAKNMRYCWGVTSAGQRARLPLPSNSITLYQEGGSFTLHGRSYDVDGIIGEKRKVSALG